MTSYIVIFIILFLFSYMFFFEWEYSSVPAALIACVLLYPANWLYSGASSKLDADRAIVAGRNDAWLASMVAAGCRNTSFVGTRNSITGVWTCPDSSAHLDLR